jgi:hypothetical protein
MKIELDITKCMLAQIDEHLQQRTLEIDGHIERSTLSDQVLSRVLCGARKAGYGKQKRHSALQPGQRSLEKNRR